jgi:hypothetical protein
MRNQDLMNNLATIIAVIGLIIGLCSMSKADDYQGPRGFNVKFSTETSVQEVVWQSLNLVDTAQTLYIADHPAQWQEMNEAWIVGSHPSRKGVFVLMAGFAVLHYAVTAGIESLVRDNPDYRVIQRVWEYSTLTDKTYNVVHNHSEGIRP